MQEVIFNIGVSGSGKTTWSIDHIKKNLKLLRINRDDIRKTLVGDLTGYYKRKDVHYVEALVTMIENNIGEKALINGYSLIIDNTNLSIKAINDKINAILRYNSHYGKNVTFKFKIFPIDSKYILKDRISKRDSLLETDLEYIDKQIKALPIIIDHINKNYKDQIINE